MKLEKHAEIAEAYRTFRTNLFYAIPQAKNKKIIVASPIYQEKQAAFVFHAAQCIAQAGKRVLLVDTDLKHDSIAHLLNAEYTHGFFDLLKEKVMCDDCVLSQKQIDIIFSGKPRGNSSELLETNKAIEILKQIERKYDCILFNGSPINTVIDTAVLARTTSTDVILTMQSGKIERKAVKQAIHLLETIHVQVLGMVLLDAKSRSKN